VDTACIFGGAFFLIGLVATFFAIFVWGRAGFGDMESHAIVRVAALAVVSFSLGIQTITAGFLWGMLSQRVDASNTARTLPGFVKAPS
jgi:hypothetical protein